MDNIFLRHWAVEVGNAGSGRVHGCMWARTWADALDSFLEGIEIPQGACEARAVEVDEQRERFSAL